MKKVIIAIIVFISACACSCPLRAQSSDQNLPTPILTNEINGRIEPLDVGDARMTRHYYAFAATPGDLLIALESKNLNGDLDVFTAVTFRPLMKVTMYADINSAELTKGIYLRTNQILILRVEARTPNDASGTYHIQFRGSFAPFSGGIPVAEVTQSSPSSNERSEANRLSSVGATISRPANETAEVPKPEPTPETKAAETTETKPATTAKTTAARRSTARNSRRGVRSSRAKRAPTAQPQPTTTETTKVKLGEIETKPAEKPAEIKPVEEGKPKTQEAATLPAAHLIIEEKDGTRIDRPMSAVRRLTIEGATIVIILKTGKIERISMSDVVRVAIEPQQ